MGKIFCLMGKSSCGKDTIYKKILSDASLPLKTLIPYTTRPARDEETNGVEYYFLTDEEQKQLALQGKIIELRAYQVFYCERPSAQSGASPLSHHRDTGILSQVTGIFRS